MPDDRLQHDAYTANELAERLTDWLAADVWPGYTGYCDACPEPAVDRSVDRCPFFVVEITRGAYGVNRGNASQSAATADVSILLQIRTSKTDGTDYLWAVRTLRDCIDALGQKLYNPPNGVIFGALPGNLSWEIPAAQPRPVWQARIDISFELRSAARDNGGFLI